MHVDIHIYSPGHAYGVLLVPMHESLLTFMASWAERVGFIIGAATAERRAAMALSCSLICLHKCVILRGMHASTTRNKEISKPRSFKETSKKKKFQKQRNFKTKKFKKKPKKFQKKEISKSKKFQKKKFQNQRNFQNVRQSRMPG